MIEDWKRISKICTKIFKILVFYIIGVIFYHYNMGWSVVDCIYFITVTITSVGSVTSLLFSITISFTPFPIDTEIIRQIMEVLNSSIFALSLIAGRLFTVFYASFGLAFIFAAMNSFATSIIKAAEESALERINTNPEQNRVCLNLCLVPFSRSHATLQNRYIAKFLLSIASIVVCVLIGTTFVIFNENLNFFQGLYWSTMTTLVSLLPSVLSSVHEE
jgi:hypothetical protein